MTPWLLAVAWSAASGGLATAQSPAPGVGPAPNPAPGLAAPKANVPVPPTRPIAPVPAPPPSAAQVPAPVPTQGSAAPAAPPAAPAPPSQPAGPAPVQAPAAGYAPVQTQPAYAPVQAPPAAAVAAPVMQIQAAPPSAAPSATVQPQPAAAGTGTPQPAAAGAPVYPPPQSVAGAAPQPSAAAPAGQAAAPVAVAAAASPEESPKQRAKPQSNCIGGGFCIGPMLTAGLINVIGIGAHARTDYWGFGFDYQFIGLGYDDVDGDLSLVTVEGRVYPFGNVFYLSAGIAWQHVALETQVHVPEMQGLPAFDVDAQGVVNLTLLKLGLGFMGRDGLVFGIDLGFGLRLARVRVDLRTNLPRIAEVIDAENEFRSAAKSWIEYLPFTPQLNLVRVGYLF